MADLRTYAKKASEELHIPLNGCLNVNDLIQIYYSLHILMGGDAELMRHFLNTHNKHLGFNPAAMLCDEKSVQKLIGYLESFINR
jgi:hypothetical protein